MREGVSGGEGEEGGTSAQLLSQCCFLRQNSIKQCGPVIGNWKVGGG